MVEAEGNFSLLQVNLERQPMQPTQPTQRSLHYLPGVSQEIQDNVAATLFARMFPFALPANQRRQGVELEESYERMLDQTEQLNGHAMRMQADSFNNAVKLGEFAAKKVSQNVDVRKSMDRSLRHRWSTPEELGQKMLAEFFTIHESSEEGDQQDCDICTQICPYKMTESFVHDLSSCFPREERKEPVMNKHEKIQEVKQPIKMWAEEPIHVPRCNDTDGFPMQVCLPEWALDNNFNRFLAAGGHTDVEDPEELADNVFDAILDVQGQTSQTEPENLTEADQGQNLAEAFLPPLQVPTEKPSLEMLPGYTRADIHSDESGALQLSEEFVDDIRTLNYDIELETEADKGVIRASPETNQSFEMISEMLFGGYSGEVAPAAQAPAQNGSLGSWDGITEKDEQVLNSYSAQTVSESIAVPDSEAGQDQNLYLAKANDIKPNAVSEKIGLDLMVDKKRTSGKLGPILIIYITYADQKPALSEQQVKALFWKKPGVADVVRQSSWGLLTLDPEDVYFFRMVSDVNPENWGDDLKKVRDAIVNQQSYKTFKKTEGDAFVKARRKRGKTDFAHELFFLGPARRSFYASGFLGGYYSNYAGPGVTWQTVAHELTHNFGMAHSNGFSKKGYQHYNDESLMGFSRKRPQDWNAVMRWHMGWIPEGNYTAPTNDCQDVPALNGGIWQDAHGRDCKTYSWYNVGNLMCRMHGDKGANTHCCICGGGRISIKDIGATLRSLNYGPKPSSNSQLLLVVPCSQCAEMKCNHKGSCSEDRGGEGLGGHIYLSFRYDHPDETYGTEETKGIYDKPAIRKKRKELKMTNVIHVHFKAKASRNVELWNTLEPGETYQIPHKANIREKFNMWIHPCKFKMGAEFEGVVKTANVGVSTTSEEAARAACEDPKAYKKPPRTFIHDLECKICATLTFGWTSRCNELYNTWKCDPIKRQAYRNLFDSRSWKERGFEAMMKDIVDLIKFAGQKR